MDVNSYDIVAHEQALNDVPVYVSYTADYITSNFKHVHNSCEILIVEAGEATYEIDDTTYTLRKNDMLIIGSLSPHFRRITRTPFIRYGITLLPSYLRTNTLLRDFQSIFQTPSGEQFKKMQNLSDDVVTELIEIVLRLRKESTENKYAADKMILVYTQLFTILLSRILNQKEIPQPEDIAYPVICSVKVYIEKHYYSDLSLNTLSNLFFMHPSTISHYFKKYNNISITSFINRIRITNAAKIITNSNSTMHSVAHKVGYTNENTFIRQFKSLVGQTPLQYRKSYLHSQISQKTERFF